MKSCLTVFMTAALLISLGYMANAQQAQEPNLLKNGGFESPATSAGELPDDWDTFTSQNDTVSIVEKVGQDGGQAVRIGAQSSANANVGIFQKAQVEGGARYTFSAFVMNNPTNALKGSGYGEMSLEWKDDTGKEIGRSRSKPWGPELSKKTWQQVTLVERAPSRASSCSAVVTLFDGPASRGSSGSFLIDDVTLTSK